MVHFVFGRPVTVIDHLIITKRYVREIGLGTGTAVLGQRKLVLCLGRIYRRVVFPERLGLAVLLTFRRASSIIRLDWLWLVEMWLVGLAWLVVVV